MKRIILKAVLLAAGMTLFAQPGRVQFDLFGGEAYSKAGSTLDCGIEGKALMVSGTASGVAGGGGGYVIETLGNLEFSERNRLIIIVSGITGAERFDSMKLLKLELNNQAQITTTAGMRNRNDPAYINARNGEAVFDISRLRNIRKINLVFFNCTVADLKIEVFYE